MQGAKRFQLYSSKHPPGYTYWIFNSSSTGQNGRHFADEFFRCIFVNKKFGILIKISLKFVPKPG